MAIKTRFSNVLIGAMLDQITTLLDSGTAAGGLLVIFDGVKPATCEDADVGTVLAELPLSSPAFFGYTDLDPGARIAADSISADATTIAGTAQYFRAYNCNTAQTYANRVTCYIQGTVGTSNADIILDTVTITNGGALTVSSWTLALPELFLGV